MPEWHEAKTLTAYGCQAKTAIDQWRKNKTPTPFLKQFASLLLPEDRVLDLGCGLGHELHWLAQSGFQVQGIDGAQAFIDYARKRYPQLNLRKAYFSQLKLPQHSFQGIWSNAALMHMPPAAFSSLLKPLKAALVPGGLLGLTMAWGRRKGILEHDWIGGRYFACYTKPELAQIFKNWQIERLAVVSNQGRKGRWIHVLARG